MGKFDNLINNPTHSFDCYFGSTVTQEQIKPVIYRWKDYVVATTSIDEAVKIISEYFEFEVNVEEIEELGTGVVWLS